MGSEHSIHQKARAEAGQQPIEQKQTQAPQAVASSFNYQETLDKLKIVAERFPAFLAWTNELLDKLTGKTTATTQAGTQMAFGPNGETNVDACCKATLEAAMHTVCCAMQSCHACEKQQ